MIFDDLTSLFVALICVLFGWLLHEISSLVSLRREKKKILRSVLSNYLELWFIIINVANNIEMLTSHLGGKLKGTIPDLSSKDEALLQETLKTVKEDILKPKVSQGIDEVQEDYEDAVIELATVDPMLAFRLRGKSKAYDMLFDQLKKDLDRIKSIIPSESTQDDKVISRIDETLCSKLRQGMLNNFERDMLGIAWKVSLFTWIKLKRTISKIKKPNLNEMDKGWDSLMAEINKAVDEPKQK